MKAVLPLMLLALPGIASFASAAKDAPWVIGPFVKGRLPEWKALGGTIASGRTDSLTIAWSKGIALLACEVNRDWSGYQALQVDYTGPEGTAASITLTDSDGILWKANPGSGTRCISFKQFKPETPSARLDLALLKEVRIKFQNANPTARPVEIHRIALCQSKGLYGPGINMDITFNYYRRKPWTEIVQNAKDNGFTCIHVVDINLQPEGFSELAEKVKAIHKAGLDAVLTLYPTTDHVSYERYPDWRQKSLNGSSHYDWRTYLCPNHEVFMAYLEKKLHTAFSKIEFDGLELAEPWFEVWGGPEAKQVGGYYTCVCDCCRTKFKIDSGVDPLDLFNRNSVRYFRRNPELYRKWMSFRVDTLNTMMKRLFTAARAGRPGIATIAMHLSDCRVEPGKSREYQGQDFESIVTNVKPDALIIESAWQDWVQSKLDPVYIADYGKAYISRRGKTRLLSQCDIGSSKEAKRGIEWLRMFSSTSNGAGFEGYVAYEYSIGLDLIQPDR